MCLSIAIELPDHVVSKGEHNGHEWVTVHNGQGYRCGYVRVLVGHPWHGKDYGDIIADVHGGLTFAEADVQCDAPGEDNAWWVGFDCAHLFDMPDLSLPFESEISRRSAEQMHSIAGNSRYSRLRTQEYVEDQCRSLCDQAAEVAGKK